MSSSNKERQLRLQKECVVENLDCPRDGARASCGVESSRVFVKRRRREEVVNIGSRALTFSPPSPALLTAHPVPPLLKMQSDDVIWSVINQQFCSYKVK